MRILLADANPPVCAALGLVIEQQAGLLVVGEAHDAINLFSQVVGGCPDAVLLDADLPGLHLPRRAKNAPLAELIGSLRVVCPSIRVIAMSSQPDAEKACLLAGADGFLCKSDPPDTLAGLLERLLHRTSKRTNGQSH